jgi:iron complex transport system ATP-binding protein
MPADSSILSIDTLEIGYGSGFTIRRLLPPLSASAAKGELVAVIGRNGIGKSTLLRTITGLQPSLGGTIHINGDDISRISRLELAQRIGYISTEVIRVSNMKVYDLVALGRYPYTNWIGKIDKRSGEAIEGAIFKTGMTSLTNRYISELSDGERQRVMIARVLAQDADIMIMDEPTAYLDIMSRHDIINLMLCLTREGKTIIFSTHDFNIALSQADKVWLTLEDMIMEGAPEDLVICNAFNKLFDSSAVGFNNIDGSFSFKSETRGCMHVKGEGILKIWTEKAVKRAGYTITDENILPSLQIPGPSSSEWKLQTKNQLMDFKSIYSLVRYLSRKTSMLT